MLWILLESIGVHWSPLESSGVQSTLVQLRIWNTGGTVKTSISPKTVSLDT